MVSRKMFNSLYCEIRSGKKRSIIKSSKLDEDEYFESNFGCCIYFD